MNKRNSFHFESIYFYTYLVFIIIKLQFFFIFIIISFNFISNYKNTLIFIDFKIDLFDFFYSLGKYFVDFEIPVELANLWRYMYHMYQLDAFTQSCPADQDIINHYKLQQVGVSNHFTNI